MWNNYYTYKSASHALHRLLYIVPHIGTLYPYNRMRGFYISYQNLTHMHYHKPSINEKGMFDYVYTTRHMSTQQRSGYDMR